MNNLVTRFAAMTLSLVLVGCASFSNLSHDENIDWAFKGKMAVKNSVEASSFNVIWRQEASAFDIELSGPLGQGRINVYGDHASATLVQGKDQWTANSLEDLLWDLQQISLPLDYLRYWVRALPKPNEPFKQQLNETSGFINELTQAGWTVQYSRYQDSPPFMPTKLSFSREDRSGKLVIREWSLLQ